MYSRGLLLRPVLALLLLLRPAHWLVAADTGKYHVYTTIKSRSHRLFLIVTRNAWSNVCSGFGVAWQGKSARYPVKLVSGCREGRSSVSAFVSFWDTLLQWSDDSALSSVPA